jgi:hypothetical protein
VTTSNICFKVILSEKVRIRPGLLYWRVRKVMIILKIRVTLLLIKLSSIYIFINHRIDLFSRKEDNAIKSNVYKAHKTDLPSSLDKDTSQLIFSKNINYVSVTFHTEKRLDFIGSQK